ncbi:hypothetical protein Gohar_018656, partial [Gossypium harknessii]|nr:hypothetical protein [Gossypium harknessii]
MGMHRVVWLARVNPKTGVSARGEVSSKRLKMQSMKTVAVTARVMMRRNVAPERQAAPKYFSCTVPIHGLNTGLGRIWVVVPMGKATPKD